MKQQYQNNELAQLANELESGAYTALERALFACLERNHDSVKRELEFWQQKTGKTLSPVFAAKQLLMRKKSVDVKTEIALQYDEILREAWYRGEANHDRVAVEWAKQHARGWRDHYTLTLVMILEAREDEFLRQYRSRLNA